MAARARTHPKPALDVAGHARRLFGRLLLAILEFTALVFGRTADLGGDDAWLDGPSEEGDVVGPEAHLRAARREGLDVWEFPDGGLLHSFEALASPTFHPALIDPRIHEFYEETARHHLTVGAKWSGPVAPLARMTIATAGPACDNLNLPLDPGELAAGLDSRVISLVEPDGDHRWTCWLRRKRTGEVVYAGFYGTAEVPEHDGPCVKTVFPIPRGHITVVLEPTHHPDGGLDLRSAGAGWGDAGFYVCRRTGPDSARVLKLPLGESIRVFLDGDDLRTDHAFSFLGSKFLHLDYGIAA